MKTITLNIIKKNRVYFKCINEKGYEVKLKVTPKSNNLELGKQNLLVHDVSVRTKYGTDIIYDLEAEVKNDRIVTLKSQYNANLVETCKELGGKWDQESKVWIFSAIVEDKVEELDELYNTDLITVEVTAMTEKYSGRDSVNFLGYRLAKATSRDSGAKVCDGVALIKGRVYSGGSARNWGTWVDAGSTFRLQVARKVLENAGVLETWDVQIITTEGM